MFLAIKLVAGDWGDNHQVDDGSSKENFEFLNALSVVRLKRRLAYPTSFAELDNDQVKFGYGQKQAALKQGTYDSLLCTLDMRRNTFKVARDDLCTLPLFCYESETVCLISDSLEWIVSECPELSIDTKSLTNLLVLPSINEATLYRQVTLLTSDLEVKLGNQLLYTHTSPKRIQRVVKPSRPKEFKQRLEDTLEHYWAFSTQAKCAFEVSGGIDSATMPLFVASRQSPEAPQLASMIFTNEFKGTQLQKLYELENATGGQVIPVEIDSLEHFPLERFFNPLRPRPFYQYQEIYTEALEGLAKLLQASKVELVFTGIGGDELFEPDVHDKSAVEPKDLPYLHKGALPKAMLSKELNRLVADSAFFAGQSRNTIYIDHGIWPVAPLADPQLLQFCRGLEFQFKANKNILRAYFETVQFPESIYRPVQNEHFGRFFEDSMQRNYRSVLQQLADDNQLEKHKIVDWSKLIEFFEAAQSKEYSGLDLFAVFRTVTAEIILRSACQKLQN